MGDVLHEAEGAGAGDLAAEGLRPDVERERLFADQRMIEVDLGLDPEAVLVGPQFAEGAVLRDAHRLDDFDVAARQRARGQAGLIDRIDEGRGAAVHDRHFRPVDLDDDVVDVEAAQRGQQMLGGRAQRAGGIAQHGREFGGGDGAHVGADLALDRAVGGDALEHDTGIVVGRMQSECDGAAGMDADAGEGSLVAQRCLLSALHQPVSASLHCRLRVPLRRPQRSHISAFNSATTRKLWKAAPRDRKVPYAAET